MKTNASLLRWLPLLLLVFILALALYFHLYHYLSFTTLQQHREFLLHWTQQHYLPAVILFSALYISVVTISIPGALFLTLAGGFLFGVILGTVYVVCSATLGSILLFLAVNTALGHYLENRAQKWIKKMEQGFQRNAFNYLLTLRLIPIFPFWLVNIAAALLNIPLRTFIIATALGIIPGTFIYVAIGNGLNQLFAIGQTPNLSIIFTLPILLPLIGLALLALLPVLYNYFKGKRHD